MKTNPAQLSLFRRGPLPSQPFMLEPSPDVIILCKQCRRQIVAQHHVAGGVESEYTRDGLCFECAEAER